MYIERGWDVCCIFTLAVCFAVVVVVFPARGDKILMADNSGAGGTW